MSLRDSDWVLARSEPAPRRRDRVKTRWETLADPDGTMTRAARRQKAAQLMKEHMQKMRSSRTAQIERAETPQPRASSLSKYGLTVAEFNDMLEKQGGVCALCSGPPRRGHRLVVDHCHDSGRVRGLLCGRCNTLLGGYEEHVRNPSIKGYLDGAEVNVTRIDL